MPAAEPKVDTAPFDLPGSKRVAALCLHGLTGTPYEVRPHGEALSQAGIRAVGPALPGHNETPQSLARVRYQQWLEAARVQRLSFHAFQQLPGGWPDGWGLLSQLPRASAVRGIAEHRMTHVCQVYPDLVGSTGQQC